MKRILILALMISLNGCASNSGDDWKPNNGARTNKGEIEQPLMMDYKRSCRNC